MKSKRPLPYAKEEAIALGAVEPFGCVVERSAHMFEVFVIRGKGVQLVVYPHRTTAGNYHLRVRDNGSMDKARAAQIMRAMDEGAGLHNCTFSRKG